MLNRRALPHEMKHHLCVFMVQLLLLPSSDSNFKLQCARFERWPVSRFLQNLPVKESTSLSSPPLPLTNLVNRLRCPSVFRRSKMNRVKRRRWANAILTLTKVTEYGAILPRSIILKVKLSHYRSGQAFGVPGN